MEIKNEKDINWMISELKTSIDELIKQKEMCFSDAEDFNHLIAEKAAQIRKYEKKLKTDINDNT